MKMWLRLKVEEFWIFLARNAPKPLVYYCGIRMIGWATRGEIRLDNPLLLSGQEILKRWNKNDKK